MRKFRLLAIVLMAVIAASAVCAAPAKVKKDNTVKPSWWGRPPAQPGQKAVAKGVVENITPQSIAVKNQQGVKTFAINEQTRFMVAGKKATINDVKAGDQVIVRFRPVENNVLLALGVAVPKPNCAGQIASIQGNTLVLKNPKTNTECRVVVNANTKYRSRGYQGTLEDLKVGYRAVAAGTPSDAGLVADVVEFVPMVAKGTITAVEGNVVTLKAVRQMTIQGQVSPATFIIVSPRVAPDRKGTLADVKVGTPANIGFHANPNGPVALLWIDLLTGQ